MLIRGRVIAVIQGVIQRFTAHGRPEEEIADRELFQHYGYTSRPLPGAELVMIREGNHIVAIASEDRRYRLALEEGEVALYDDQGQKVHLKRNKEIEVSGCDRLTASAAVSATVTTPQLTVVASTKVTLDTPLVEMTGNLQVAGNVAAGGNVQATGNVADAGGAKTMSGMRATFDAHTHAHPADGQPIPAPAAGM